MRADQIKFRGKSKKDGKWLFGDLLRNVDGDFAVVPPFGIHLTDYCDPYEVNPDTIGQYTGLKDKNGREIYEGDIVDINYKYDDCGINGVIPDQDCICVGIVTYMPDSLRFMLSLIKAEFPLNREFEDAESVYVPFEIFDFEEIEILGNIYDNKDLLED